MPEVPTHDLALPGCTPEPLMAYLKAMGVLRLVSENDEHGDPNARGWWKNGVFRMRSRLDRNGLAEFFMSYYRPTPLLAPWNAGSGFYLKWQEEKLVELPKGTGEPTIPSDLKDKIKWVKASGTRGPQLRFNSAPDAATVARVTALFANDMAVANAIDEALKRPTFKSRDVSDAVSAIESSATIRLETYRQQVRAVKDALKKRAKQVNPDDQIATVRRTAASEGWSQKKTKDEIKKLLDGQMLFSADGKAFAIQKADKDMLVRDARSGLLGDESLLWLDAAFVIRTGRDKNRSEAALLGSGGNIGNSDFSARFMQIITELLPAGNESPSDKAAGLLGGALFGDATRGLESLAVDQFDPGRAGGANMDQGMEAGFRLNPWDYVLMLEGALVVQGASSKRLGARDAGSVFPFVVESVASGFDSAGLDTTRGEQWLPLWDRPCGAAEIRSLLAEGRAEVGGRPARNAVEFARAAASLGVDRGIRQFARIQYQARFGDNYIANALGRVDVSTRESIDLLRQIDRWLDVFRSVFSDADDKVPARFSASLRAIDRSVFDFCRNGGQSLFQRILVALGRAERELALTEGKVGNSKIKPRPLAGLSRNWVNAAKDNSHEFEVALALAGIHDQLAGKADVAKIGPFRTNLELVDWDKRYRAWATKDRSVVWNAADLSTNLAAVLERRVMDGERANCKNLPLASRDTASFGAISAFLSCEVDDERIEGLLWGLMLIDHPDSEMRNNRRAARGPSVEGSADSTDLLPSIYCLLRLLFLPRPLVAERSGENAVRWRLAGPDEPGFLRMRPEPVILSLLRTGRVGDAATVAMRRLRASGLTPLPHRRSSGVSRDHEWTELSVPLRTGRRLAASLLIPIHPDAVNALVQKVTRADDFDVRSHLLADREPQAIAADQGD